MLADMTKAQEIYAARYKAEFAAEKKREEERRQEQTRLLAAIGVKTYVPTQRT